MWDTLSPLERDKDQNRSPLPWGRGGTARRWVRGLFADEALATLEDRGTVDFVVAVLAFSTSLTSKREGFYNPICDMLDVC